jgi:hypothetical protein
MIAACLFSLHPKAGERIYQRSVSDLYDVRLRIQFILKRTAALVELRPAPDSARREERRIR